MSYHSLTRLWLALAGLLGCGGVALGAIGAHAVADLHGATMLGQAALYAIIHAGVLLALADRPGRVLLAAKSLLAFGILAFSGAIALKYLAGIAVGDLAPIGGVSLMLGWLLVAASAVARR